MITAAILETELEAGVPTAVLIDAGSANGAAVGQRGQLKNDGEVIGHFEIIDVYSRGSRGKLLGKPTSEINYKTEAQVLDKP